MKFHRITWAHGSPNITITIIFSIFWSLMMLKLHLIILFPHELFLYLSYDKVFYFGSITGHLFNYMGKEENKTRTHWREREDKSVCFRTPSLHTIQLTWCHFLLSFIRSQSRGNWISQTEGSQSCITDCKSAADPVKYLVSGIAFT